VKVVLSACCMRTMQHALAARMHKDTHSLTHSHCNTHTITNTFKECSEACVERMLHAHACACSMRSPHACTNTLSPHSLTLQHTHNFKHFFSMAALVVIGQSYEDVTFSFVLP
jgi:hypothetical protein